MYAQAVEETGYGYDTLKRAKWVADRIELCRRRHNLSWSHHLEVAKLDPEEQEALLSEAENRQLNQKDLRKLTRQYKANKTLNESRPERWRRRGINIKR